MTDEAARHDYREQAARYDRTRGASPSILEPLMRALQGAPGRRVVDVAGGTGNYASSLRERGWRPTVVDISLEMLAPARSKGLLVVRADAAHLPLADAAVDGVVNVSALHLIRDWRGALAEARRILRPGGVLAIMTYTRENLDVHWIFDYFPSARRWTVPEHQPLHELLDELPGARAEPFEFTDLDDASMAALCRRPDLLLEPAWRNQTSFFERMERDDPRGLHEGLERLALDLGDGRRPDQEIAPLRERCGDGTIIVWAKPDDASSG